MAFKEKKIFFSNHSYLSIIHCTVVLLRIFLFLKRLFIPRSNFPKLRVDCFLARDQAHASSCQILIFAKLVVFFELDY